MKQLRLFIILTFTSIPFNLYSQAHVVDTVGSTQIYIDSLIGFTSLAQDWPWDVEWGPDSHLWFTVGDKVCRYDTATHSVSVVLDRPDTTSNTMSIAFHPNFLVNPVVYVTVDTAEYYYSYSTGPIVLFKYDYSISGDSLYNETAILGWGHGGEHGGARLHVGQDGYLYCTTAEYIIGIDTVGNLRGKVLRINLDGTVPAINTTGHYYISRGHRNPQGIVQLPNGNIIISELGESIDELNLIQEYGYYGWPVFDANSCMMIDSCSSPNWNNYIHAIDTAVRPPSGITYYNHNAIPEFSGCILECILSFGGAQGGLVAIKLNPAMDSVVNEVNYFKGEYLRWRDVTYSPDGKVYAITNDRQQPRIRVIYNPNYHIGIEEYENANFKLYPNPAENFITIQSEKELNEWEIISIDGKELMNGKNAEIIFQIDVSRLTDGIYSIRIGNSTIKWIKI